MEKTAEVRNVHEAVGDRRGGNRPADLVEGPHAPRLRDVAALGRVDAVEVTDAFAMLGILAVADIDAIFEDDRRCNQLVPRLGPDGVFRVRVELPQFLPGGRLVAADPAVALGADD